MLVVFRFYVRRERYYRSKNGDFSMENAPTSLFGLGRAEQTKMSRSPSKCRNRAKIYSPRHFVDLPTVEMVTDKNDGDVTEGRARKTNERFSKIVRTDATVAFREIFSSRGRPSVSVSSIHFYRRRSYMAGGTPFLVRYRR